MVVQEDRPVAVSSAWDARMHHGVTGRFANPMDAEELLEPSFYLIELSITCFWWYGNRQNIPGTSADRSRYVLQERYSFVHFEI
jgi:hypothetical protein